MMGGGFVINFFVHNALSRYIKLFFSSYIYNYVYNKFSVFLLFLCMRYTRGKCEKRIYRTYKICIKFLKKIEALCDVK